MHSIKTDVGYITLQFEDENGEKFAEFRVNPADSRIYIRCKEILAFFHESSNFAEMDAEGLERVIEDKFCYLLGYDCRYSLFGRVAAMDVMADGRSFMAHVFDALQQHAIPKIAERRKARIEKYTKKYS